MKPQSKPLHINAEIGEIAELVLLPGDPLRAKYIAENFLENPKLVTSVRNMLGYTGTYKGKKISVMSSGMGIASAGIYVFELFYYYGVKKIIRIGTCGGLTKNLKLLDVILTDNVYSETDFGLQFCGYTEKVVEASKKLNDTIKETSKELNISINEGLVNTTSVFGPYGDSEGIYNRMPSDLKPIAEEMEGFALCLLAKYFKKEATVLLTVSDAPHIKEVVSVEDRQLALNKMIKLALESIIK